MLAFGLSGPARAQDAGALAMVDGPDAGALGYGATSDAVAPGQREPDLFGFSTLRLRSSIYDDIWREASSSALPRDDADFNAVVARLRSMPVRRRVEQANAWINARVAYARDPSVVNHHWGNLAKALSTGRGEREDIAIAKMQLLAAAGVPRRDMYLVLVRDLQRLGADALLVVRDGDQVDVLDSKQDAFVDAKLSGRYFPVLALSADGEWLFGRRYASGAARPRLEPISIGGAWGGGFRQALIAQTGSSRMSGGWRPGRGR